MPDSTDSSAADRCVEITDRATEFELPWTPDRIELRVWQRIGIDSSTLSTDIAGLGHVKEFSRRGGVDAHHMFAIDVWSQGYSVGDLQWHQGDAQFVPIVVGGRAGLHHHRPAGYRGDRCHLIFPAAHGSTSIEVQRLDPRTRTTACERALEVAEVVISALPR